MTNALDQLKKCPHCRQVKTVRDFAKNATKPDGRAGWCKVCQGEAVAKWTKEHPEYSTTRAKERRASGQAQAAEDRYHVKDGANGRQPWLEDQLEAIMAKDEKGRYTRTAAYWAKLFGRSSFAVGLMRSRLTRGAEVDQ